MLIQFAIENFMSYKEKAIFSLKPGKGNELPDHIYGDGKYKALRSAAIYGANASGKSNLLKAFTAMIMILRESNNLQINQPLFRIVPFKLDKNMINRPTSFEIIFTAEGKKYLYGFSATIKKIIDEYLYVYKTAKPTLIFERKNTDKYQFPQAESKELSELKSKNNPNKLFLSTATSWNYTHTKTPYTWLAEVMDTYDLNSWGNINFELLSGSDSKNYKTFINNLLHSADININDFSLLERKVHSDEIQQLKKVMPEELYSEFIKSQKSGVELKSYNLTTMHTVENDGVKENFSLQLQEESSGTQIYFSMAIAIKQALDKGKTMIIDEIESSLHPLLVESIIEIFNNPDMNKNNAQLVFTTHDINLLTIDKLRRDQVYFTEKHDKTAESCLYSLDDFSVRKDENIKKNYINGRYGAVPIINKEVNLWE